MGEVRLRVNGNLKPRIIGCFRLDWITSRVECGEAMITLEIKFLAKVNSMSIEMSVPALWSTRILGSATKLSRQVKPSLFGNTLV